MPKIATHRMSKLSSLLVVYVAMFILSLHWAVVVYVNSTYVSTFTTSEAVGVLYTVGSALTIFIFLFISRILRKLGNYTLTVGLTLIEIGALLGLAFFPLREVVLPLFIVHQAVIPLLLFNIDVFTEEKVGNNEKATGGIRGIILVMMAISGAVAPLISGLLVGNGDPRFHYAYIVSAVLLLPFLFLLFRYFKAFQDPKYQEVKILPTIRSFWEKKGMRHVFITGFLLQLFFTWMVIYTPLYLATEIGLAWDAIGLILFVGLMAYVFLEYPIGEIADRYIGEREMMAAGFLIMIVSTIWIAFVDTTLLIPWMLVMFATRVGASLVEATTESYFFKHTKGSDATFISFFRITRPLSYVFGALIGSLALLYIPFSYIFIVLGIILIPGIFFSLSIPDTK